MKPAVLCFGLAVLLLSARVARADAGCGNDCACDDSPENPTLLLAGLAGGVYAANTVRTRIQARRDRQEK